MYDHAICINLPERPDRRRLAEKMFAASGFDDVQFYPAIKHEDGMTGLQLTMKKLFQEYAGKKILVFEDDVILNRSKVNIMERLAWSITGFDLFYLGGNATKPMEPTWNAGTFRANGGFLTTHAVIYSEWATTHLALHLPTENISRSNTIDVYLSETIQPIRKSYAFYPAVAHQRAGYSDISKMNLDYAIYHEESKKFYNR